MFRLIPLYKVRAYRMVVYDQKHLALLMARQGIPSVYRLGHVCGIHPNNMRTMLLQNRFTNKTLTRLCRALQCTPGELLCWDQEPTAPRAS